MVLTPAEQELLRVLGMRGVREPDVECAAAAQLIERLVNQIGLLELALECAQDDGEG